MPPRAGRSKRATRRGSSAWSCSHHEPVGALSSTALGASGDRLSNSHGRRSSTGVSSSAPNRLSASANSDGSKVSSSHSWSCSFHDGPLSPVAARWPSSTTLVTAAVEDGRDLARGRVGPVRELRGERREGLVVLLFGLLQPSWWCERPRSRHRHRCRGSPRRRSPRPTASALWGTSAPGAASKPSSPPSSTSSNLRRGSDAGSAARRLGGDFAARHRTGRLGPDDADALGRGVVESPEVPVVAVHVVLVHVSSVTSLPRTGSYLE